MARQKGKTKSKRLGKLAYCQQLAAGGSDIRGICIKMIDLCDNFRQHLCGRVTHMAEIKFGFWARRKNLN